MTRRLRDAYLVGLCLIPFISINTSIVDAAAQKAGAQSMPMESDQMTNIPYFTLRDGMSSTLTLNNLDAVAPTKVTVTIFNMQGRAQELPPMTLGPASITKINLADVVAGKEFDSGNIQVAFRGIPMTVTCQVSVFSLEHRVSFESREQDMMDFRSVNLNGILSLPRAGAEGFLAVTNASKNTVTVQLTVGSKKEDISLLPRETRLVKLPEQHDERSPLATLVKLQHNGLPGDVITTGFVLGLKDKYSSTFIMVDPSTSRSSKLAGAHFRSGRPDPSEGFPKGTEFRSPLLLANVGTAPVTAHVSVGYTVQEKLEMTRWETRDTQKDPSEQQEPSATQNKFSNVALKDVTIAPGVVQRIELSDALGGAGLIEEAGVDIAYDAAPGTVIGHLVSVDRSGDYSFEVPVKDPSAMGETIESAYPWTIENGTSTVVHLKNTTDKSATAIAVLVFPGGGNYNLDRIILEPYESVAIDIQKLKDSKKPDALNHGFPSDATHGLLYWHQEIPYSMVGRAEETNLKEGIARSFSCNSGCCDDYYTVNSFFFSPGSLTGVGSFSGKEDYITCHNVHYSSANATAYSWSSDNTSVATVSGGTVSYVGSGTATITGNFEYHVYYLDGSSVCQDLWPSTSFMDSATAQVTEPTLACTPSSVTRGSTITCSVTPSTGITFSNWKFTGNFIVTSANTNSSWSGIMVTSGVVSVTANGAVLSAAVVVNNRSGFAFSAVSPVEKSNNFTCPQGVVLSIPSPPTNPPGTLGKYCVEVPFTFVTTTVTDNGPNNGYLYVASASPSSGSYAWVYDYAISPDLENASSAFSVAQCGNYNAQSNPNGYITRANLLANAVRHESGSVLSHYAQYTTAVNNSQYNIGTVAEQQLATPGTTTNTFGNNVTGVLTSAQTNITSATNTPEPPAVNYDSTNTYQGGVNFYPYASCN